MIPPIWLLKYLPNMLACHISILLDCQGPSNTITEAEAASNLAIGEAARIIAKGRADVMISGGADSKIHPLSLVRMSLLDQMSRWQGDPSQACRPFDSGRDGWVAGEGAGILILEEREHALAAGRRIYGEILGFGSGCDANPAAGSTPTASAPRSPSGPRSATPGWPRRGRPRQRPRRRRRSSRTSPSRGPSGGSSGTRRRAGDGPEGLHGQHRLGLRGGRVDRRACSASIGA